jgi:poly(3-hydroxybutyrate) depolymerase
LTGECPAYVPENYDARVPPGVIIWLHAPGGDAENELVTRWKPVCERYGFILLAPKAADKEGWRPADARMVRRFLDELTRRYSTDLARLVIHGRESGGALAYLVAFANADRVRAVATVDAALPRQVQMPETDPANRLAIYVASSAGNDAAAAIDASIKRLREQKFPVTVKPIAEKGHDLNDQELDELVRWFDSLDRF